MHVFLILLAMLGGVQLDVEPQEMKDMASCVANLPVLKEKMPDLSFICVEVNDVDEKGHKLGKGV